MFSVKRGAMVLGVLAWVLLTPTTLLADGAFSGGGGPFAVGALLDLSELSKSFNDALDIQGDFNFGNEQYFLMYGGGGFGGADFRLGGMATSGEWTFPATSTKMAFNRVIFSMSMQGFMFDHVVGEMDLGDFSIGGLIGFGSMELRLIQDFQGSFQDFIKNPPLKFSMNRNFGFVQPFATLEIRLLDFMGVRLSAGYNVNLSIGEWQLVDGQSVPGGPMKAFGYPSLQFMVIFGG
ncbi:hypothetical protein HY229_00065 [Candidatus Acetothermia bacterium]|nr:hypothetical protein [Candidatus Acetothermia bacterium]MBI3642490.1 hypothetical protein [Candidatus Acetothermia bacterium]